MSRANAPRILAVKRAMPPHYLDQESILRGLLPLIAPGGEVPLARLEQLHRSVKVRGRHLAVPPEEYAPLDTFAKRNAVWTKVALELGEEAIRGVLDEAGLEPRDVDHIFFTTVTGIAVPSIDARLANKLGFRSDVKRTPIFGLGCVAGTAGVARAADYLRGHPGEVAVVLAVELCSLTLQRDDRSIANLIASALFGDGAAAVLLGGADRSARAKGPAVAASRSIFYPDTEGVMGWELVDGGFRVILSGDVPEMARANTGRDVDAFLGSLELGRADIRHWVCHTGGPRVLEAFEESLGIPREALARSWRSLEECGNLSSASVLLVLEDLLASRSAAPGDKGLMLSMGPGFCAEQVLLEW